MSRRRRWTPVRGIGNRIYEPGERLLVGALDLPLQAILGAARLFGYGRSAPLDLAAVREVLVLRLDRIGDVLMSLPALADLRAALPRARIRLAVGRWSAEIAQGAPVDEVLVWSAPWVGRAHEGAEPLRALVQRARALRATSLDLALDLQGDVRANLLLAASGARQRVGYANSGGGALLTSAVPLDETVSWVEQNRRAVAQALGLGATEATGVRGRSHAAAGAPEARAPGFTPGASRPVDPLLPADRDFAARLFENLRLGQRGPLIGIHPSGGRLVKQWPVERWAELAASLERRFDAEFVFTGSQVDQPLAQQLTRACRRLSFDLAGKLGVRETLAVIERLDLFLSPDTGPMHMACAVGTPSLAVFGPSDPRRYFSGGSGAPGARHVVVRAELWCSPCNLIRKPPAECAGAEPPECLRLVTVAQVEAEAARLLEAGRRSS